MLCRTLTFVGVLLAAGAVRAQTPCPAENLLAGRAPAAWTDLRGRAQLATDGEVAPEGATWDAPLAVRLDTAAATLTWDLGAVTELRAAYVQADANDSYGIWGSLDGRAFRPLARVDVVDGHGLRGRNVNLGGAPVRFLRFGEGVGDGFYSLAELAVFCALPTPFPPAMRVGQARPAEVARGFYSYWNNETSARWELVLALLGVALLGWGVTLRRQGRPDAHRRLRDRLLALLGGLSALTFVNFGFFHFGNFIHVHEWTHYYLGAKYFPQLSYERLYECLSVADVEAGLRRRVELRPITNLRTNVLERTEGILADPGRCTRHFTPERWQAFSRDATFFRQRTSAKLWDDVHLDHGYNATPVWNAAGNLLTNLAPASATQLYLLALLDPLYYLGTIAVIWWAFGWRVLSVALLVFATNFPSRFYWTGGAFLRWDWLFYLVAAICCLKRQRPALAGAALAYATALRVFPLFLFVGPALALGWSYYRERRLDRPWLRFFAGAALAAALLVPAGTALSGGLAAQRAFVANTIKHKETPLVNHMGLRTVLAWRPDEVGRHLRDGRLINPWSRWKEARLRAWRQARPLAVLLAIGAVALLALIVRREPPWVALAASITLVPFGAELTSYYYAFLVGVALLVERREQVGRWLLLLTAFTGFVAWAPLRNMSQWADEQYTLMSLATLVALGAVLWLFARSRDEPPA